MICHLDCGVDNSEKYRWEKVYTLANDDIFKANEVNVKKLYKAYKNKEKLLQKG